MNPTLPLPLLPAHSDTLTALLAIHSNDRRRRSSVLHVWVVRDTFDEETPVDEPLEGPRRPRNPLKDLVGSFDLTPATRLGREGKTPPFLVDVQDEASVDLAERMAFDLIVVGTRHSHRDNLARYGRRQLVVMVADGRLDRHLGVVMRRGAHVLYGGARWALGRTLLELWKSAQRDLLQPQNHWEGFVDLKRILVYDDESCTLYGATVDMRTLEVRSNYEVRNLVTLLHDARHQPGLNTCPPWLFEWLKAYPERCRRGLSLLWGLEEGRQLCETHPLLALCCVEKMVRAQLDRDAACTLWRMKRRDLVRWCFQHVPSDLAKRALKILSRVEFSLQENTVARAAGMTPSFDTVLRDARTVHALSHWPHTQIGWWSLLASELRGRHGRGVACFNHSPLFRHLGQREQPVDLTRVMRLWNDTRELGRVLGVDVGVHLAGCRTVDGLHRLHDLWTEEFNRGGPAEADGTPSFHRVPPVVFPDPPVPETTYIQAIRTSHALRREGYEMRHCVGSYQRRIMAGGTFVYRVLQPHRATLQLARSEAGEWRVAALLGRRNRPVPQESHERVRQWLTLETEKRAQAAAELEAQARRESMQRQRRVEVRMISGAPSGEQGSQTGGRFEVSLGEIELASLQRRGNPVLPFAAPPVPERTPALDPEPEPVRRPQLSVWDVGFLVVMVCAAAEVFSRVL